MADTRPLTKRLKEDNWDLHQVAEQAPIPSSMASGSMTVDQYKSFLGQMWLVNRVLDGRVRGAAEADTRVAALVSDEQLQTPYLERDLAYFEVDTETIEPWAGTRRLIDHIEASSSDPLKILGLHYVREGANNGNKFVAMKLRKAHGWPEDRGTDYLKPYGDRQRPLWEAFKTRLDETDFSEEEKAAIGASVRSMYEYTISLPSAEHIAEHELLAGANLDREAFDRAHAVGGHPH